MTDRPSFSGPALCALSATQVVQMLKTGEVSSRDLVEASLARIAQTSPAINAMVTPCPDRARDAAQSARNDTLLAGLPLGIKDLTDVAGVRSTRGTQAKANRVPDTSDPLVVRIEDRGGVVIGKTNTPEEGAGANTFNAIFGMTRNPWDTRKSAAGSSGGAAASLASGETWLSHGSDYGGSLRSPASFCGVVGLRPSPGVAAGGSFAPESVQGPMARSVADCALFLDVMTGFDPTWPLSYPAPHTPYAEMAVRDAGPIRLGFAPDLGGFAPVEANVAAVLAGAMELASRAGVAVEDAAPETAGLDAAFRTLRGTSFLADFIETPDAVSKHYKPTIQQNVVEGRALTVIDMAEAQNTKARLYAHMRGLFQTFDVLACPVAGIAPGPVEEEYPTRIAGQDMPDYISWLRFAYLATVCGLPALSLPAGVTAEGLPVGLQLIGPPRAEARLLQVAHHLEQILALGTTPIDPVVRHSMT